MVKKQKEDPIKYLLIFAGIIILLLLISIYLGAIIARRDYKITQLQEELNKLKEQQDMVFSIPKEMFNLEMTNLTMPQCCYQYNLTQDCTCIYVRELIRTVGAYR